MKKQLYTIYFSIDNELECSEVLNKITDAISHGMYANQNGELQRIHHTGYTLLKGQGGWKKTYDEDFTVIKTYVLQIITDNNEDVYFSKLKECIKEVANQQEVLITNTIINTI